MFGGQLSHLHPTYLMMRSQADIVIGLLYRGFSMKDLDILDKRIDSTTKIFIFAHGLSEENGKALWDHTIRKVLFGYIEKEVSYIKNVIDNAIYYIEETGDYLIDWLNNPFDSTQDI